MKQFLESDLICPECLPGQIPLKLTAQKGAGDDVIEGRLTCEGCGATYEIRDGVAVIVPSKTLPVTREATGYNSVSMLSSYLWSHYSEFFNGPSATDAYRRWASVFNPQDGAALDIGCAVGRLSFEMSRTHTRVIGVDTSFAFIREARKIMTLQHLTFDQIVEGHITEEQSCDLPADFRYDAVEFIVADAMALPFRAGFFSTATSVNILEKVPDPAAHLKEADRVLSSGKANFLFSDPFSWDEAFSDPELWLGGRNEGPFSGRGMDVLCRLIEGGDSLFSPGFSIREKGELLWKIRKTAHLWEHITSQYIFAQRGGKEA